jgi:hypothetical protein
MAAGGQPSAAHESGEASDETAEVVLTRPKKLVLQPMHVAVPSDESADEVSEEESADESVDGAPLVLETAAETEAAASKLAAKLPVDKIELPLEDVALEEVADDNNPDEQSEPAQVLQSTATDTDTSTEVKNPGESAAAAMEVDPNEARAQKAEALMASGKYAVHIHESSRSRTGLIAAVIVGAVVILAVVYVALAEGMLGGSIELPKFW